MKFILDKECTYLVALYKKLFKEYALYEQGLITEEEYLLRIKPIDSAIEQQELAMLQKCLTLKKEN